ncbi:BatD family protein [Desulfopila aestuarii]|uniref:Oxygen tolerance n=1 Tax=Desulfopila aestuarii DSM 18488 TaxID=1121416 RepID=A0A1M7YEZ7_9BACT|nr:BatD family protein [Desulfopila aestuarii]SHO51207.1 Oxygen tolerance [Desulfopila aestuarii DSM 18488]
MKNILMLFFIFFSWITLSSAETAPISVRLNDDTAWIGQKVSFFIELRAMGSFSGSARFDLPQVPGTIIIKVGAPVVSSEEIDGQSWFVQSHEFALFSQQAGTLKIPEFSVRFASRAGFSGPANDVQTTFPGMKVEIQRPPGSEKSSFLVTTQSLEINEIWKPTPGPVEAGAIFTRKIAQRASELSGMALAPPSTDVPDGISVYVKNDEIADKTERGDFLGQRIDTITYRMTKAGNFTLPDVVYSWWNPITRKIEKFILPAVRFEVSPAPGSKTATRQGKMLYVWVLLALTLLSFALWQKTFIVEWLRQHWRELNPPDKILAENFLQACAQNNSASAVTFWISWRNTQGELFKPEPELQSAVFTLLRHRFGPEPSGFWQGDLLALAFTNHLNMEKEKGSEKKGKVLPELNRKNFHPA